jgi:hypothetical protein
MEIALVGIGIDAFVVSILYYFYKKGTRILKNVKVNFLPLQKFALVNFFFIT